MLSNKMHYEMDSERTGKMEMPKLIGLSNQKLEERKLGIGGSDMPIILGLSSYKTPYQLYLEKKGITSISDKISEAQYWGNRLESIIRNEFSVRNGVSIHVPDTIIHPFNDFLRANIDGYIVEWDNILEIKTSGNMDEWGEEDSDCIPLAYLVQIAYYCAIMDITTAHLAVLIGHYGFRYRQYKYVRDLQLEKTIIKAACGFWETIQKDLPPPATNQIDLKLMFPSHTIGKSINVSGEIVAHLNSLTEIKRKMKELEAIEEENRFNIMSYMNDAECLVNEQGRPLVTWKANKRGSRTFLLKGEKQ